MTLLVMMDVIQRNIIKMQIKQLKGSAILPAFQTDGSAGFDLYACMDSPATLFPGRSYLCPTGFAMHIDKPDMAAIIVPRSGLGHKQGVVLGNGTGLIDSDYQGEIFVSLVLRKLHARDVYTIRPGDRIAQMFFVPIIRPSFEIVDEFSATTKRGENGFGSTGDG